MSKSRHLEITAEVPTLSCCSSLFSEENFGQLVKGQTTRKGKFGETVLSQCSPTSVDAMEICLMYSGVLKFSKVIEFFSWLDAVGT